jgi:predicted  nucleic acid-binding Zn-ribbon protein
MLGREQETTFDAGTLAGAGTFHCEECGFSVALHERDEVPGCPHCGGTEFKRSSIFGDLNVTQEPIGTHETSEPDWLAETRDALERDGDYVAFDQDGSIRVISLSDGWTRIGRSLQAHIRFDDPTVSRRHALVHREAGGVRMLDDRSLNGIFVNGERIEMRELRDGDQITIGRFELYFMCLTGAAFREHDRAPGAFA